MTDREAKTLLYEQFARVGKALASPTRLELLDLLAQGERGVEDLAGAAGLRLSNASAQLQVLASAGLATCRRSGRRVYYRLAGDAAGLLAAHVQQFACERLAEAERAARGYLGDVAALQPVSREELARRIQAGDVLVLDVRPAAEFAAGHITGAVGIPHDELSARLSELPGGTEIVAYCRGRYCVMAPEAVRFLRHHGYAARPLQDGLPEWRLAGLPVTTRAAALPASGEQWDSPGMRLYLSSFRLGRHPELLATLAGEGARVAVIANAMDFAAEDVRREAVDRELRAMSGLGFRPGEVDLRSYFGDAALLRRDLAQYDALWVRGGNVFVLRYALHHSGGDAIAADPLAADALVYAGYSACRACSPEPARPGRGRRSGRRGGHLRRRADLEGLGLLDYSIVPRRFTASALAGISLCAWWRTMSGTSSLPMPCPSKPTAMVSRELVSVRGSTVTSTVARMGPSMPCTPHVLGALMWVNSEVTARLAPPMRRVVRHFAPTCAGPG